MPYIVKQGDRVDNRYAEIYLDTENELEDVDVDAISPGSVVFIIETGTVYILNSQKKWVAQ